MTETTKTQRRRRKAERPEEIRRAALEEIAEKGIAGSTLGGIANRAGISRTTVYLYFETKQEIFEAVARDTIERTIDDAASMLDDHDGPFATLFESVIDRIYSQIVTGDAVAILRALLAEGREQADVVAFYHREIFSKGEATVRRLIAYGIERGDLSPNAAALDPRAIMSPIMFAAMWDLVFGQVDPLDIDGFKRDHVALVLHWILANSRAASLP
ncbi:MAG: TetR/AcrR family transcriptional regulator [Pseudomonadota bacterium]